MKIKMLKYLIIPVTTGLVFALSLQYRLHLMGEPFAEGWNLFEKAYFFTIGFIAMAPVVLIGNCVTFADALSPFLLGFLTWTVIGAIVIVSASLIHNQRIKRLNQSVRDA